MVAGDSIDMSDDKSISQGMSQSFARLETDGTEERLCLDIAIRRGKWQFSTHGR